MTTITTKDGIGTADNPFSKVNPGYYKFAEANPPIPVYYKGEQYFGEIRGEAERVKQGKLSFVWRDISDLQYDNWRKANEASMHGNVYELREVYVLKSIPEMRPFPETVNQVDEYKKELIAAMQQFAAQQSAIGDKWISVEERLPENRQQVLVYVPVNGGNIFQAEWKHGYFFDDLVRVSIVTHWQPLPIPPSTNK